MDVLTSETCWAWNNEIKKQVTSNWSLYLFKYYWIRETTAFPPTIFPGVLFHIFVLGVQGFWAKFIWQKTSCAITNRLTEFRSIFCSTFQLFHPFKLQHKYTTISTTYSASDMRFPSAFKRSTAVYCVCIYTPELTGTEHLCNKNQQFAHFLWQCFSLIIVFDMFRLSKCSSSGTTLIWIHERNTINCMYKFSWVWTFGCSKNVEDTVIKLKHYCKKCALCWFLLRMYVAMHGSDNVNFSREELISSDNGQDQTDLACKSLNEPATYQLVFFYLECS